MMKITLQVNGWEMSFSEQELTAIVENHFSNSAEKPTEGKWFKVKPQSINQKLFKKERRDTRQEETRQRIIEAFAEMKKNPEKYGKNFKTMMPKKDWSSKTAAQLKEMARILGDHNADRIEQALEWAQRIANGESWKSICNDDDTANWHRLVEWDDTCSRFVGGSGNPASNVSIFGYFDGYDFDDTVPLVVAYDEEESAA